MKKSLLNGTSYAKFTLISIYLNCMIMKTRYILAVLTMGLSAAAIAQENDDMYFNSKDREKLNASNAVALTKRFGQEDQMAVRTNPVNPSDSYSGRGVNPEYNAQGKNGTSVVQNDPAYFIPNYAPTNVNQSLYNGYGNNYSSNYYGSSAFSNPYYGMGGYGGYYSPYSVMNPYSMFYSPYSMYGASMYGMYSPYSMYGSGLSMSYGFGSMYGMYSPYSMFGMGYGSMYGMYNPYYGYGYGYGSSYVVTGMESNVVQGRHPSRSSSLNNSFVADRSRMNSTTTAGATRSASNAGGRVATTGNSSGTNYYDRSWRDNSSNYTTTGTTSGSRGSYGGWGNTGNSGNSGYSNSAGRSSSTMGTWGGGNSGGRGSFGGGGGMSGGGGGGGGGGHSRGRN